MTAETRMEERAATECTSSYCTPWRFVVRCAHFDQKWVQLEGPMGDPDRSCAVWAGDGADASSQYVGLYSTEADAVAAFNDAIERLLRGAS